MTNKISFKDKITGGIRGGAIGDALGLAVEKKTKAEIVALVGDIREYMPIKNNGFLDKEFQKPNFIFKPEDSGIISDDTIFSMAGMESITEKNKIDIQHLFDAHKKFFDQYGGRWFGGATRKKFEAYTGDIKTLHNISRGNGIMMKQFPYAAYFASLDTSRPVKDTSSSELEEIITVTHDSPVAKITGLLHNKTLIYLLQSQPENFDAEMLLNSLLRSAHHYEDRLIDPENPGYNPDTHMMVSPIIKKLINQQKSIIAGNPYSLQQILDTYIISLDDPVENKKMKPGFHVASTFGLVYACFLQNQDFDGLLNAIRIGYDTDTQGAIIGNMIGALKGPFYDQKYIDGIQDKEKIQEVLSGFLNRIVL